MFEEYLQDSYEFLVRAQKARESSSNREARRYYRASVFYAASALEAFVNYIADSFAKAENLTQLEIAFLNDKAFISDKGELAEKVEFHKLDDKLRLLIHKFLPGFPFNSRLWSGLMEFRDFRHSLVHPRQSDDETELAVYNRRVTSGLSATIQLMNHISKGIFKKPLRNQLLDLIPEQSGHDLTSP